MSSKRINVTKAFLPPIGEYQQYIERIWESNYLTNQGPLLNEFEKAVSGYLGVDGLQFVTNGTLALQLAIRSLEIGNAEVITTPFSYVATTSAILWEGCTPVFVDIEPNTFCIDSSKIEAAITSRTRAILAVHVFGNPCAVEEIELIAKKHSLKVIYDGAHAFGALYKNKALLEYGDISMCSFHATKVFHTIEGGCLVTKDSKLQYKINLLKRFGHNGDDHLMLGINAKASEFQAAMGLAVLPYVDKLIRKRRTVCELYNKLIGDGPIKPRPRNPDEHNYPYYPIVFKTPERMRATMTALKDNNIYPRRYFYPSLNQLTYINNTQACPVSEDITQRILCLPLYADLNKTDIERIAIIINNVNAL